MRTSEEPTVIDLFCGAGGLSLGFEEAGFQVASGVDCDKHAIKVFDQNRDSTGLLADVTSDTIKTKIEDNISSNGFSPEEIDVVIGGPPCKGFSRANMQTRSIDNPLNDLPRRFIDLVDHFEPRAFVLENVPEILTIDNSNFNKELHKKLGRLGYNTKTTILDSSKFGVPQRRERMFFLGVRIGDPPIPSPEYSRNEWIPVRDAINDLPELPTGGGGEDVMEYDPSIEDVSSFVEELRNGSSEGLIFDHRTSVNREKTYRRFQHISPGGNWRDIPEELMSNYSNPERTHDNIYYRLDPEEPAKTVTNFRKQMFVHPDQNRLLSVREAARLQTFPDWYRFECGSLNRKQQMVGDAVPVKMAKSVGRSMFNHLVRTKDNGTGRAKSTGESQE